MKDLRYVNSPESIYTKSKLEKLPCSFLICELKMRRKINMQEEIYWLLLEEFRHVE
jgi:hypothetical protein